MILWLRHLVAIRCSIWKARNVIPSVIVHKLDYIFVNLIIIIIIPDVVKKRWLDADLSPVIYVIHFLAY